ncbi:MAG: hypothetical protein ABII94_02645, partial [Patescibacteria group bacterium]
MKWLVKNQKVKFWSIFTISLEPILSKIPEKIHSLRLAAEYGGPPRRKTSFFFLKEKIWSA